MTLDELAALPARVAALEQALARRHGVRLAHEQAAIDMMLWAPALTETEASLLPYLAAGWTNQEIARHVSVSERTVRTHVTNVLTKFHAANRTTVGLWALATGTVSLIDAVRLMAQQQPHLIVENEV